MLKAKAYYEKKGIGTWIFIKMLTGNYQKQKKNLNRKHRYSRNYS